MSYRAQNTARTADRDSCTAYADHPAMCSGWSLVVLASLCALASAPAACASNRLHSSASVSSLFAALGEDIDPSRKHTTPINVARFMLPMVARSGGDVKLNGRAGAFAGSASLDVVEVTARSVERNPASLGSLPLAVSDEINSVHRRPEPLSPETPYPTAKVAVVVRGCDVVVESVAGPDGFADIPGRIVSRIHEGIDHAKTDRAYLRRSIGVLRVQERVPGAIVPNRQRRRGSGRWPAPVAPLRPNLIAEATDGTAWASLPSAHRRHSISRGACIAPFSKSVDHASIGRGGPCVDSVGHVVVPVFDGHNQGRPIELHHPPAAIGSPGHVHGDEHGSLIPAVLLGGVDVGAARLNERGADSGRGKDRAAGELDRIVVDMDGCPAELPRAADSRGDARAVLAGRSGRALRSRGPSGTSRASRTRDAGGRALGAALTLGTLRPGRTCWAYRASHTGGASGTRIPLRAGRPLKPHQSLLSSLPVTRTEERHQRNHNTPHGPKGHARMPIASILNVGTGASNG